MRHTREEGCAALQAQKFAGTHLASSARRLGNATHLALSL